jgi:hypothetical protein
LRRGALIAQRIGFAKGDAVIFQYNPETLSRRLNREAQVDAASNGLTGEAMRLSGPAQETIRLEAVLDATDQLEKGEGPASFVGLHPQLAALEMLVYPKSAYVISNDALLRVGVIEVVPPEAPLTLFVWGPCRVLPVRLTEFSINEEFYDPNLNPIRAKVTLSMRVYNYRDLGLASTGGAMFMAHQIAKEAFATMSTGVHVASGIQELTR